MDRLQSMRVFQQVGDDSSFVAAARKLDMSGAVATRLVGDLESNLGVQLLQRTTRRMALTDAGETFLTWVRHILNDIDEAHAATQSHAPEMSGVIRILTPGIFAVHTLRHWLQIYQPATRSWCWTFMLIHRWCLRWRITT